MEHCVLCLNSGQHLVQRPYKNGQSPFRKYYFKKPTQQDISRLVEVEKSTPYFKGRGGTLIKYLLFYHFVGVIDIHVVTKFHHFSATVFLNLNDRFKKTD